MQSTHAFIFRRNRAFSLIEAAIVLAIVGIVIGGIWAAASAVNDKMKWERTEAGLLYYATRITKSYSGKNALGCNSGGCPLSAFYQSIPLPAGWTANNATGPSFRPIDPYGNRFYSEVVCSASSCTFTMGYPWQTITDKRYCARVKQVMIDKISRIAPTYYLGWESGCAPQRGLPQSYYYNNCCSDGNVSAYFTLFAN